MNAPFIRRVLLSTAMLFIAVITNCTVAAQTKNQVVRLAKIKVDTAQMERFNMALKEQMSTAIKLEPGVLTYYAVADKNDPGSITILEIYADTAAYQSHITTAHFKKYKAAVKDIVTSLVLTDVNLIYAAKKPGL